MDTENIMNRLWRVELEIMDVIHKICVDNGLKYSLAYGTLLGAVRHQGFIPWDDDIDIMMPRQDYEKLISIWSSEAPEEYILQTYRTNLDYTNNFAKIRRDSTTFLQDECEITKSYRKGIFVDVFPIDKVPNNRVARKIQYIACAINLLYTRGFKSGRKGIYAILESVLLCCSPRKYSKRRLKAEKIVRFWNQKAKKYKLFSACTIESCRKLYSEDFFEHCLTMEFCHREYYVTHRWDEMLRKEYEDYMKLPPKCERVWKHHPIVIDFEHNFEDIEEKNEGEVDSIIRF